VPGRFTQRRGGGGVARRTKVSKGESYLFDGGWARFSVAVLHEKNQKAGCLTTSERKKRYSEWMGARQERNRQLEERVKSRYTTSQWKRAKKRFETRKPERETAVSPAYGDWPGRT